MRRVILRYLGFALLGALLLHVVGSLLLGLGTAAAYRNRMMDVHHLDFDSASIPDLVSAFFIDTVERADKPTALFLGSSFTWGYSWQEDGTFAWKAQERLPRYAVVNGSVIGDPPIWTLGDLCVLERLGIRSDVLVVELNLTNFRTFSRLEEVVQMMADHRCGENHAVTDALDRLSPYLGYYLTHLYGCNHLRIMRDEHDYPQPERPFDFTPLPDGYMSRYEAFMASNAIRAFVVNQIVARARRISDRVYLFVAPIQLRELAQSQFPPEEIEAELDALHELCERTEGATCLQALKNLDKRYFMNLTHINLAGHDYFAGYFADLIEKGLSGRGDQPSGADAGEEGEEERLRALR